jgi:hypothetical protein
MSSTPRDGNQQVAGIGWLARMIDKARLQAAGELEALDLDYPCPMDQGLLRRLGVDSNTFQAIVVANPSDEGIITGLQQAGAALEAAASR